MDFRAIFVKMKLISKIFSLFLIAFLLLSISGINMHIHFCSRAQVLYADLQWNQTESGHDCHENSSHKNSCCSPSEKNCQEPVIDENDCDHCSDIVLEAKAENDYFLTSSKEIVDIAAVELFQISTLYPLNIIANAYLPNYIVYHPPPEAKYTSNWLC